VIIAAGWVHRHWLIVIEFLQAENRMLKDRLSGRRIRVTNAPESHDLATTKASSRVQLCGDCDFLTFALVATPEPQFLYDLNDFDETHPE